MLFTAGVHDQEVALSMFKLATRLEKPQRVLTPRLLARAGWVNARVAVTQANRR
jgi:hypothetical protein